MNPEDLESYRRLETRGEALAAFDRIVGRAQRRLQLFDESGEFWRLERKVFADAAQALLDRSRDATVTIVVHDTDYIERRCARLLALLRRRAPRLKVLRSDPSTRVFSRGVVIADATVVLRRPHFDRPGEVNLEKALRLADRLGGHLVSGHVDGLGTVTGFDPVGESWRLVVRAPASLGRYLAYKGSITVNGVSLTVNRVRDLGEGTEFEVNLIPHTVSVTTLKALKVGDAVNLEVDLIARYVERMLADLRPGRGSGVG